MTTGGKSYYYLTDALGSVLALVDETGAKVNEYRYSPRGVDGVFTEKVPQPYRYADGYQDPTGLYHYGARYYDPRIGRFTSPDPSGQEKNPYLYAEGDPVNRIDPSGLFSLSDVTETVGGALGTVVAGAATAAVCAAATIGCIAVGIGMGALGGGSGAAIGAALGGADNEDTTDAFYNGALGGALGASPLSKAPFIRNLF
ncbi:RHS repeat-associated core domain-containing protein [Streptomyces sp. NPDC087440]|uniref:RHS repeat-associated core domain-containing protein n=1 Tax=Streptomyces sp. NPDC087440 TaxID=3365790 RepID=UPI00382715DD